ncbi:efflux RND transporter periplasmic adaptor subunit [Thermaurantiacus sp.]
MAGRRKGLAPLLAVALLLVAAALGYLYVRPAPVEVDLGTVDRGPVVVTVRNRAVASVHDRYDVAAPVSGRLQRIEVEVGDPVKARETVVARLLPADPGFLDARTRDVMQARLAEARARAAAARAGVLRAEAAVRVASQEMARVRELVRKGWQAQAALDRARATHDEAIATLKAARAEVDVAEQAEAEARAALSGPLGAGRNGPIPLTSPVSGTVLTLYRKSETVVPAGEPLVAIGDPAGDLEIVADLLSTDAVRVKPGAPVRIVGWGGKEALPGRVRLVEPFGYLKVSALGVEEQRVNVRIDLVAPPAARPALGHGYRVDVEIETDRADHALRLPVSALVRDGGEWAVYVAEGGRARLRRVRLGLMNDDVAEVLEGVREGEQLVLFPAESIGEGSRLRRRA